LIMIVAALACAGVITLAQKNGRAIVSLEP